MTHPPPAYLTLHGSHAYGLNTIHSDIDQRGFFFANPENFFGLEEGPSTVSSDPFQPDVDYTIWEFRKFVRLATHANPNVIETLFTDPNDVLIIDGIGHTLRTNAADWFLSRKVEGTYGGYARQQFGKLSKNFDRWEDVGVRKDAMHCVRLIYMAEEMLTTGKLTVKFDAQKHPDKVNFMLSIRRGQVKPLMVHQWAQGKLDEISALRKASLLPEEPKMEAIDRFVQDAVKRHYGL